MSETQSQKRLVNKKRLFLIVIVLLILLIGIPIGRLYREVQQQRRDQALIAAVKVGNNGRLLELLADGANGEVRETAKPPSFRDALFHLLDRVRHHGASAAGQVDTDHPNALLLLYLEPARKGKGSGPELTVVRALLDHGARINDRDKEGCSPLWYAAQFSSRDTVKLLLARGADINLAGVNGFTPLMGADAGVTEVLLAQGANIEAKNKFGYTALVYAAMGGKTDVVRMLLKQGANIEVVDDTKQTALIWAVNNRDLDTTRVLLEYGAKLSPKDQHGQTALDYARIYALDYAGGFAHSNIGAPRKIESLLQRYNATTSHVPMKPGR